MRNTDFDTFHRIEAAPVYIPNDVRQHRCIPGGLLVGSQGAGCAPGMFCLIRVSVGRNGESMLRGSEHVAE